MGAIFGPDKNRELNQEVEGVGSSSRRGFVKVIRIPTGVKLRMVFSSHADHENAILGYKYNNISLLRTNEVLVERGNYSRSLEDAVLGPYGEEVYVMITGWHKRGAPNSSLSWFQSEIKVSSDTSRTSLAGMGVLGFEDSIDLDHNDMCMSWMYV